jgi:hypothetical protein
MLTVGFGYFLFLYIDIRLHVKKAKRAVKERENRMMLFQEQLAANEVDPSIDSTWGFNCYRVLACALGTFAELIIVGQRKSAASHAQLPQ